MTVETDRTRLIEHILDLNMKLEQLEQALRPVVPREWLSADVTMTQLRVLLILFRDGPTRMSGIASGLGVSFATATGIADRLVERGLVIRENSVEDRRVVVCRLSPQGEKLMSRLWRSGQEQIKHMLEKMTLWQLEVVARGTQIFIDAAKSLQGDSQGGKS